MRGLFKSALLFGTIIATVNIAALMSGYDHDIGTSPLTPSALIIVDEGPPLPAEPLVEPTTTHLGDTGSPDPTQTPHHISDAPPEQSLLRSYERRSIVMHTDGSPNQRARAETGRIHAGITASRMLCRIMRREPSNNATQPWRG